MSDYQINITGDASQVLRAFQQAITEGRKFDSVIGQMTGGLYDYNAGAKRFVDSQNHFASGLKVLNAIGVQTTEQINRQITAYDALLARFKGDQAATRELTARKKALEAQLHSTTAAVEKQAAAGGSLITSLSRLVGMGTVLAASSTVAYLKSAAQSALHAERDLRLMEAAVESAGREFGSTVGSVDAWRKAMLGLRGELVVYSERDVAAAIDRTVTMTKRLGMTQTQMEEIVKRAGWLAVGKTDLTGAVERVTAAMRGEAESAEYLGLSLSENAVKAYALSHGLKKELWPGLDEAGKAALRFQMFLEQSAGAQEKAIVYASTQAGQMDVLAQKYEKAKESLGGYVLKWLEFSGVMDMMQGKWGAGLTKLVNPFDAYTSSGSSGTAAKPTGGPLAGSGGKSPFGTIDYLQRIREAAKGASAPVDELVNRLNAVGRAASGGGSKGERLPQKTLLEREKVHAGELARELEYLNSIDGDRAFKLKQQNAELEKQIELMRLVGGRRVQQALATPGRLGPKGSQAMPAGDSTGIATYDASAGEEIERINSALDDKMFASIDSFDTGLQALQQTLQSGVSEGLFNLAGAMGAVVSGSGSFSNAGNVILGSLADMAINVGKISIATGVAMTGIKNALTKWFMGIGPAGAIAAGTALVAIGTAVKGSLSNVASGGSGTSSFGYSGTAPFGGVIEAGAPLAWPQTSSMQGTLARLDNTLRGIQTRGIEASFNYSAYHQAGKQAGYMNELVGVSR